MPERAVLRSPQRSAAPGGAAGWSLTPRTACRRPSTKCSTWRCCGCPLKSTPLICTVALTPRGVPPTITATQLDDPSACPQTPSDLQGLSTQGPCSANGTALPASHDKVRAQAWDPRPAKELTAIIRRVGWPKVTEQNRVLSRDERRELTAQTSQLDRADLNDEDGELQSMPICLKRSGDPGPSLVVRNVVGNESAPSVPSHLSRTPTYRAWLPSNMPRIIRA